MTGPSFKAVWGLRCLYEFVKCWKLDAVGLTVMSVARTATQTLARASAAQEGFSSVWLEPKSPGRNC